MKKSGEKKTVRMQLVISQKEADVEDLRERLDGLWDQMDRLLRGFANIS